MDLSIFQNYLFIINIIGLVLYLINLLLYRYTADSEIDSLITIVSLLGGSIGILVPLLIFQRKLNKEKESIMMSTVFFVLHNSYTNCFILYDSKWCIFNSI